MMVFRNSTDTSTSHGLLCSFRTPEIVLLAFWRVHPIHMAFATVFSRLVDWFWWLVVFFLYTKSMMGLQYTKNPNEIKLKPFPITPKTIISINLWVITTCGNASQTKSHSDFGTIAA